MSAVSGTKLWTSDELFALRPNKKVDRCLFRGELRESKVTRRNPSHSRTTAMLSTLLNVWLMKKSKPRGAIYDGEGYFRIRSNPDTNVGIDVAYASAEQVAATADNASFVDGPPVIAIEVLSPYDKHKDIVEAIDEYLDCGVKAVWIVDPYTDTVAVHRLDKEPKYYTLSDTIATQPELPGFKCRVADIFE